MLDRLSELAANQSTRAEAREGLFKLISENPSDARARVVLAKTFYDDGLLEFSVRELIEARKYSESPTLIRLLEAFGDHARRLGYKAEATSSAQNVVAEETVGEIELEVDFESAVDKLK